MPRENREDFRGGIRYAGALTPSLIPLILKLGTTYLRFKKKAQKAARIFQKELRAQGIDKQTAKAMTEIYLESSHILRNFDFSDFLEPGRPNGEKNI